MKKPFWLPLAGGLTALLTLAARPLPAPPDAPTAGHLTYEFTQRLDLSKAKMMGVGAQGQTTDLSMAGVQMRGPDGSLVELPRTVSQRREVYFNGSQARESGGGGARVVMHMSAGSTQPVEQAAPYTEQRYLDLAARTVTTVVTVEGTTYAQAPQPVPAQPADWHELAATRKIAGYLCHKATATYQQHPCTLWVTTELPFTYSPVRELTPTRGVVLALSTDEQQYTATQLTAEPVDPATLRPAPGARPATAVELTELREQAQAAATRRRIEQLTNGRQ